MNVEHRTSNVERRTRIKTGVVIVAAGEGRRMKGREKLFHLVGGVPLLALTIGAYQRHPEIEVVVLVGNEEVIGRFEKELRNKYGLSKVIATAPGGARRQDSVFNGLQAFPEQPGIVLIHDGDRPFVDREIISAVLEGAGKGGAIAAVPVKDTVKKVDGSRIIIDTPARTELRLAQTPQGFPYGIIMSAHEKAREEEWVVTDDASMVEQMGGEVRVVDGSYDNIKITTPEDLVLAEIIYREWGVGSR
ncbi:MAG: 2-C-methyl-D-erythritol 4-phosphate cytidylyltransferase [Candidatus Auribacterota bacterium]|nr:2-C-methyl-D-erythritol 4-phosphate cytidylyltransferase [Candidatus Auribacterota bacterium]